VEEGRSVFDNLTKIIVWTLPTNIGEGMIILAALVLGVVLPILPLQVLWINMTTGALLGIVLALELREAGIMKRPPRNPQAPILTRELVWRVLIVSTLILIGAFGLFEYKIATGVDLARARTVAVNVVIVIEIFYLFNCRSLTLSVFRIGVLSSRWAVVGVSGMVVLMLLFTYAPFMNTIFHSAPLTLVDWAQIVALGVLPFIVIEVEKWLRCRDSSHASVHRSG
jgi:Ca2+-transporting ATPase